MRKLNRRDIHSATGTSSSRLARGRTQILRAACAGSGLEALEGRTLMSANLVVNTGSDTDGPGLMTFRDAINQANTDGGTDHIFFSLDVTTVTLGSLALPAITAPVVIDGGMYKGLQRPAVIIDGALAGHNADGSVVNANGLVVNSTGSTIEGLWIQNFSGNGIVVSGSGNTIGGTYAERNIVSNNKLDGILVTPAGTGLTANANTIVGNFVGTDDTGSGAKGNSLDGIEINGATNTVIRGNLISGNSLDGLVLTGVSGHTTVAGNTIGPDVTGLSVLGNTGLGMKIVDSTGVTVGGLTGADANTISGNFGGGLLLKGSTGVVVEGNFIGTDAHGSANPTDNSGNNFGNLGEGVQICDDGNFISGNDVIGGAAGGAGNVISSNNGNGVAVNTQGTGIVIQGNFIGTDRAGMLADGNHGDGLKLDSAATVKGNVIGGNQANGLDVVSGSTVQGNWIGVGMDGVTFLGNGGDGVSISGNGNSISGNTIADNGERGVDVKHGTGNAIRRNNIFANGYIGIDLVEPNEATYSTTNGAFGTDGPNNFQNYAVISGVITDGTYVKISGTLAADANTDYEIDLFSNAAGDTTTDSSGTSVNTEGQTYLGTVTVHTDGTGHVSFTQTLTAAVADGQWISATATDVVAGNTSEFSRSFQAVMVTVVTPTPTPAPTPTPPTPPPTPSSPVAIATTTTLKSSANPSLFGDAVTFSSTVTGSNSALATGSVTFTLTDAGNNVVGKYTVALSGGKASVTLSSLAIGSYTVKASYTPTDSTYSVSDATPLTQTVKQKSFSLGGTIYNDATGNGLSADDKGLAGVTVQLWVDTNGDGKLDTGDTQVASTTSGTTGAYSFTVAAPDLTHKYFATEVTPTGYVRTAPALSATYTLAAVNGGATSQLDFDNYYKCNCSGSVSNISYYVNGHCYTDLRGHTHEGDTVVVKFTVAPGHSEKISLVDYTAPGSTFDANVADKQVIYQFATGTFNSGVHTMTVTIPKCFYQVDFVCGSAIDHFGPANSNVFYSAEGRLYSADNSGTHAQSAVLFSSATDMSRYNT